MVSSVLQIPISKSEKVWGIGTLRCLPCAYPSLPLLVWKWGWSCQQADLSHIIVLFLLLLLSSPRKCKDTTMFKNNNKRERQHSETPCKFGVALKLAAASSGSCFALRRERPAALNPSGGRKGRCENCEEAVFCQTLLPCSLQPHSPTAALLQALW